MGAQGSGKCYNFLLISSVSSHVARFRDELVPFDQGTPHSRLTALMPSGGCQLRHSPVGFRSQFHCTTNCQWVFILSGRMRIGLQDGSSRDFAPGQHFYSADVSRHIKTRWLYQIVKRSLRCFPKASRSTRMCTGTAAGSWATTAWSPCSCAARSHVTHGVSRAVMMPLFLLGWFPTCK